MSMKFIMNVKCLSAISRLLLRLCLGLGISLVLCGFLSTQAYAKGNQQPNAFFAYLANCQSTPALVAFNPVDFDPRRPLDLNEAALASLREDLKALKPAFDGLVIYEYRPILSKAILTAAQEQGYKAVLLGIWNPKSDVEIKGVAELVTQFHDKLALAVVIGNEGLIDNRYTLEDVQAAVKKLRALLPTKTIIPFATSEPVSEYGLAALREIGDFLAPNIHPAIDQNSVDPPAAVAWVKKRAQALATIAKKPVIVKETGVPNGTASYTPEAQRAYWHEYLQGGNFVQADNSPWLSFAAAFEAFDMPWKAETSKMPIEGHWGLFNNKRVAYPAFEEWRRAKSMPSPAAAKVKRCQ